MMVADLETKNRAMSADLAIAYRDKNELQSKYDDLRASYTALAAQNSTTGSNAGALTETLEHERALRKTAEIAALNNHAKVEELSTQLTAANDEIRCLMAQMTDLGRDQEQSTVALKTEIKQLQHQLHTAISENAKNLLHKQALEQAKSQLNSELHDNAKNALQLAKKLADTEKVRYTSQMILWLTMFAQSRPVSVAASCSTLKRQSARRWRSSSTASALIRRTYSSRYDKNKHETSPAAAARARSQRWMTRRTETAPTHSPNHALANKRR